MDIDLDRLEALALSDDREAAIAALVPGTAAHDYWRGVLLQHEGKLDEVDALLRAWSALHPDDHAPLERLRRRQLLLCASCDLPAHADALRFEATLRFDDQAEAEIAAQRYPTRLDPAAIAPDTLLRQALEDVSDLRCVTAYGLTDLVARAGDLDPTRARDLLRRLPRANMPGVVPLLARELSDPRSGGFDALTIQHLLSLDQLLELEGLVPSLARDAGWVLAVVARHRPPEHVDIEIDLDARRAYLDGLLAFVERLPPAFHALRAQALYHRLDVDRHLGTFDRARFLRYLDVPRAAPHVAPAWLARFPANERVQLGRGPLTIEGLAPIADEEPLVREHLHHFLLHEEADAFAERLLRDYVVAELATARLLAGAPDAARYAGMLGEGRTATLRDRVDIELTARNPRVFAGSAEVSLDVALKNVPELTVKVFRIDTLAYFLASGAEVDTAFDLDGMVASHERTLAFDAPAMRRQPITVALPECARQGAYIVELIGHGRASRALIKKGALRFTSRICAAGLAVRVFDEAGEPLSGARLWMGSREFAAGEDGEIRLPFSTRPGRVPVLLVHGDVTQWAEIEAPAEAYRLTASFHLDRQSIVAGKPARVRIRAALSVAGAPVPVSLLEAPRVEITVRDLQGVSATKTEAVTLRDDAEATIELRVPEDAEHIEARLVGVVRAASTEQTVPLEARASQAINGVHRTDRTEVMHLATTDAGHVLHLLGKSGEPRPGRAIPITIKHAAVTFGVSTMLSTDERGRIELGPLPGVERVTAGQESFWIWPEAQAPSVIGAEAFTEITLPAPPFVEPGEIAEALCLRERRHGHTLRDCTDRVRLERRALVISGLEPGQYRLDARGLSTSILLEIAPQKPSTRALGVAFQGPIGVSLSPPLPLVRGLSDRGDHVMIELSGAGPGTRVHVLATLFRPSPALSPDLAGPTPARRTTRSAPSLSSYLSGRDIGDEVRYILARRAARRRPGVMLAKPSLLLQPWARRTTTTQRQAISHGDVLRSAAARPMAPPAPKPAGEAPSQGAEGSIASFDFLRAGAVVIANLRPDAQGLIRVPRAQLGDAQLVRAIVVDPELTTSADLALPEVSPAHRDRRLHLALDPEGHFAEERKISPLPRGATVVVDDVRTGKLELVDALPRARQLLLTLSDDETLDDFEFVTRWSQIAPDERARLYGEYACHELHLFLAEKDPETFSRVVRPTLANKLHPTFIDRYLLGEDLRAYLDPWAFGRLNALEKALLARRHPEHRASIARFLGDAVDCAPLDPARDAWLVDTLLGAAVLEGGAASGGAAEMDAMLMDAGDDELEEERESPKLAKKKRAQLRAEGDADEPDFSAEGAFGGLGRGGGGGARDRADLLERAKGEPLYRAADKTEELAETSYYKKRVDEATADLVPPSRFVRDLCLHREGPFLSPHLGDAAQSFTAAMAYLAFVDLPFTAAAHAVAVDDVRLTLTAESHALAAEARVAAIASTGEGSRQVLVGQSYVRADDAWAWEGAEQREKYVRGPLLAGVVYTCRVTVTNLESRARRLDLLLQIPRGAVPVSAGLTTRTRHLHLGAHGTEASSYAFYFPSPGHFGHFPAHVTEGGALVAFAAPTTLEVVRELAAGDDGSWSHVSQHGSLEDVLRFLERENLGRIDLDRIAFRMRDMESFTRVTALLSGRHTYHDKLWSYGLYHADRARTSEWLRHQDTLLRPVEPHFQSELVSLDPVARGLYEHLEYAPLINARAHRLGERREILNDALAAQYRAFLEVVAHAPKPTDEDLLVAAQVAFCLDHVDRALSLLARVRPERVATKAQYDYLAAYAACCKGDLAEARRLIAPSLDHPVERLRRRAAALAAMLDEAEGRVKGASEGRSESGDRATTPRASARPTLDMANEGGQIVLQHRHLTAAHVRFYRMDIELLFSREPFVQGDVSRFSWIDPGETIELLLSPSGRTIVPIPASLAGQNLVASAEAEGLRASVAHYAHDLAVEIAHSHGELRVLRASTQAPMPATYVKVYARQKDRAVQFYKDGYTDLRGRFDYATLSTDDLDHTARFAILLVSDEAGATVVEAPPPTR